MASWLALAMSPSIVRRATKVALLVGTILICINHGDALVRGELTRVQLLKMVLTYIVPYCVSTYAAVSAVREHPPPRL